MKLFSYFYTETTFLRVCCKLVLILEIFFVSILLHANAVAYLQLFTFDRGVSRPRCA